MEILRYLRLHWDRVGAVVALLAGVVSLVLGYVGTAGTEYIAEQIPYLISNGLGAILLLTVGAVLWISADLRDEWRVMCKQSEAIRTEQAERREELREFLRQELAAQGVGNGHRGTPA